MTPTNDEKILILWTTDQIETVEHMLLVYAENAPEYGWFKQVTILVWGASQKLLAENEELQVRVHGLSEDGIKFYACRHCAEELNVIEELETCDLEVIYTGEFLSNWLKSGKPFLSV